ncbi:15-hydroxyprostaglandin dehydrogenase [NAD(+)]-like [Euwallacea fornicatus]|uniref:15-hydroxyprostaglandin dehydrogenase [NAD(+)]-like n=1 Tax=Euwallacea fornicatus TaxID=995702 RepID=UPI00338D7697
MATFQVKGKAALVTGGASGLGLTYAKNLLQRGAKGVTLADVSPDLGKEAVRLLENEFGKNKATFIKTDVSNYHQFEEAFKRTIAEFNNIDILINNAGILNDSVWEREIEINVNGTINGMLLGLESYIPKYKSGPEGVILNISSVVGIAPLACLPIYVGSKFAVHGMTLSWGLKSHYDRTKVRVMAVCPGVTMTPLITEAHGRNLGPAYEELTKEIATLPSQTTEDIGPHVMTVIEKAPSGTMWVIEGGDRPYQYTIPNRFDGIDKVFLE